MFNKNTAPREEQLPGLPEREPPSEGPQMPTGPAPTPGIPPRPSYFPQGAYDEMLMAIRQGKITPSQAKQIIDEYEPEENTIDATRSAPPRPTNMSEKEYILWMEGIEKGELTIKQMEERVAELSGSREARGLPPSDPRAGPPIRRGGLSGDRGI